MNGGAWGADAPEPRTADAGGMVESTLVGNVVTMWECARLRAVGGSWSPVGSRYFGQDQKRAGTATRRATAAISLRCVLGRLGLRGSRLTASQEHPL